MNVAFFLKPKSEVSFLYCDTPLPQALDIMQRHGYSSVPVIDREGRYVSTVREGDFLNSLVRTDGEHLYLTEAHAAETRCLQDVLTVVVDDLRLCSVKPCEDTERRFCFEVVSPTK